MKLVNSKPVWLRRYLPTDRRYEEVRRLLQRTQLHTVCQEAHCPNQWECFSSKTATFLILGKYCTRNCRFCAVEKSIPENPDINEATRIGETVAILGLKHVVVTSVTRDDLPDGGASFFAKTIQEIYRINPEVTVEVLIPDFRGDVCALKTVVSAAPAIINHNIETVARLYTEVRPQASYERSLQVLAAVKKMAPPIATKSGIMLGLGEKGHEVEKTMDDLLVAGCDLLTMGQYLQPSLQHLPVQRYVAPDEFSVWQKKAIARGFKNAVCGPFVRSSYKASELINFLTP